MSQRVEGITAQLPIYYCMVRPHISLVPQVATSSSYVSQTTRSVNWSEGDGSIEIVDGLEGKTVEEYGCFSAFTQTLNLDLASKQWNNQLVSPLSDPPLRAGLLWQVGCAKQRCFTASGCWRNRPRDRNCWLQAPTEKLR